MFRTIGRAVATVKTAAKTANTDVVRMTARVSTIPTNTKLAVPNEHGHVQSTRLDATTSHGHGQHARSSCTPISPAYENRLGSEGSQGNRALGSHSRECERFTRWTRRLADRRTPFTKAERTGQEFKPRANMHRL